ncbi:MAG: DUF1559 domain-containing protein, partial [Pirellulales bacterium]|nr:DUF1559 domain-containing protein [Pirellulales bacterium]
YWVGEPERGTDKSQPGGWMFNLLDYMEQTQIREMGLGTSGAHRIKALAARCAVPVAGFICPSRRPVLAYPDYHTNYCTKDVVANMPIDASFRSDYAMNAGDQSTNQFTGSSAHEPTRLSEGDDPTWPWSDTSNLTGVCFLRSMIGLGDVTNGATQTYLIGEKYIDPDDYQTGSDAGDREICYVGFDNDTFRTAYARPRQDRPGVQDTIAFGSAHASGFHMLFCDGSVHMVDYTIDLYVHRALANREDGRTVKLSDVVK